MTPAEIEAALRLAEDVKEKTALPLANDEATAYKLARISAPYLADAVVRLAAECERLRIDNKAHRDLFDLNPSALYSRTKLAEQERDAAIAERAAARELVADAAHMLGRCAQYVRSASIDYADDGDHAHARALKKLAVDAAEFAEEHGGRDG